MKSNSSCRADSSSPGSVVDPDGVPVAGAEIWIEQSHPGFYAADLVTRAGADGRFAVEAVSPRAEIGAQAPGFTPSVLVEPSALPLDKRGRRTALLSLGAPGGRVAGHVLDSARRPVRDALVKVGARGGHIVRLPSGLSGTAARPLLLSTDPRGAFLSTGDVAPGRQPIAVMAAGWPIWSGSIEITADATASVEVVMDQPARIEGVVRDTAGNPIEGARVVAAVEHGGGWYFEAFPSPSTTSNAVGHYTLGWIPPGPQQINAHKPQQPALGKAKTEIDCAAGTTRILDLVLDPGATIDGRVVDRQGKALAGWRVSTVNDLHVYPRQTRVSPDGAFRLANLQPGHRYTLQVSAPGDPPVPPRAERAAVLPGARDVELVVADASQADARRPRPPPRTRRPSARGRAADVLP